MKKFLLLVVMVVLGVAAMAQSTNKISYQAVIRDGQNRLAVDQNITVKVTIGSYVETFNATTNSNGLVSLQIPNTNVAAFEAIDWSTATITTEVTVGSDVMTNTVPVTAVPYALDVNTNSATVGAIYDKIKADSTTLHDAMIDTAGNIRTDMSTMNTNLQNSINENKQAIIDSSAHIRTEMSTMNTNLQNGIDQNKQAIIDSSANIRTEMSTMNTNLQNGIDQNKQAIIDSSANIRSEMSTMNTNLQNGINENKQAIIDSSAHIRTEMSTMNTNLQNGINENKQAIIDSSAHIRNEINALNTNLTTNYTTTTDLEANYATKTEVTTNVDSVKGNIRNEISALNTNLTTNYTTTTDLVATYATKTELNDYAKTTDVAATYATKTEVTTNVDSVKGNIRSEISALKTDMTTNYATKTKVQNDSIAISSNLRDTAQVLRNLINNLPKEHVLRVVSPTANQTAFTLASEPSANYLVKMFINGVLVGDNDGTDAVITVSGTTVTYIPANNGNKEIETTDKIVFYYFY